MINLKPCPFCGSDGEVATFDYEGKSYWYARCTHCGVYSEIDAETEEIAVTSWNTRPIEDELRAVLKSTIDLCNKWRKKSEGQTKRE